MGVCCIGWYSHRQRGIRAKSRETDDPDTHRENIPIDRSELHAQKSEGEGPLASFVSTWVMLIKRLYEVDPLQCPHCGLWEGPLRTLASARSPPGSPWRAADAPSELEMVLDAEFLESERLAGEDVEWRDLQLVLDPEFL